MLYVHSRPDYNKEKHGESQNYVILAESNYDVDAENQQIIKQIPEQFDDNIEKLGIEVPEDKKVIEFNQLDEEFFAEKSSIPSNFRITKDLKRELKFALKRGDVLKFNFRLQRMILKT